ncbi:hypothetical protein P691DRAFT_794941 [Macrolepiota fuliginosa MF-IS2]|uniref:Uncharacterized protein n=1 Tax=Macrolepiota fuliginosa MF-IS2 TaxID=1400762 RepID=A0A9P6C034_9AGAR|nr:hypothetical protein P691DRAFT_794941 [Macrolepiota fuliginosa MF-IS2]
MTEPFLKGLPLDFRSFYRLFRRSCSAAVLHHRPTTIALRNMYRPTFRRVGWIHMRIRQEASENPEMATKQRAWIDVWNKRMDNTLSLLYNSSHTRGLPHQLTKFVTYFTYTERRLHAERKNAGLTWNPHLPPDSPQYQPQPLKPGKATKRAKEERMKMFTEQALGPLREVIRMAEGRDEISFGNFKKYTRARGRKPPPRPQNLPQ